MASVVARTGVLRTVEHHERNALPAKFEQPLCFDPRRDANPHLSFARYSPHVCLGAHLARLEMKAVLSAVVTHCSRVSAASPPRFRPSNFVNEMESLPMIFTKRIHS